MHRWRVFTANVITESVCLVGARMQAVDCRSGAVRLNTVERNG